MAYRRGRRSGSYRRAPARRRAQNVSCHKLIVRGSTLVGGDEQYRIANVLASAEQSNWYGKDLSTRGNAIVGLRGNFWWWTDASFDVVQQVNWLGVGMIAENMDVISAVDPSLNEEIGPLDVQGRYRPWHYRRTVPVINRSVATDGGTPGFDQAHQMSINRVPIRVHRAEKFMSVRDHYDMVVQTDADYQVGVAWQFQLYVREP